LSVYPNPAKTIFAISLNDEPQGKIVISISNTSGTKVMELEAEKGNYNFYKEIPVSELSEGVYYVTVTIDRINEYYSKIVIVK
jgi:hypothetical protein